MLYKGMHPTTSQSPERAFALLLEACRLCGANPRNAELLRVSQTAVFELPATNAIARVSRFQASKSSVRKELNVARWLSRNKIMTVIPHPDYSEPVELKDYYVTFWELIPDRLKARKLYKPLGSLIRQIHELQKPNFPLPQLNPFPKINLRLAEERSSGLSAEACDFLQGLSRELQTNVHAEILDSQKIPIHGDSHIGNIIPAKSGFYICDFESFCLGPALWDYAPVGVAVDRFSVSESDFQAFCGKEDADPRDSSYYPWIKRVRELSMVTWMMGTLQGNPKAVEEFELRVNTLKDPQDRTDWTAM
jgi:thiamine kinase-like enzyme